MTARLSLLLLGAGVLAAPAALHAQNWSPPSRQMPAMPERAGMQGGGASAAGPWLGSMAGAAGVGAGDVRAAGEGGGARAKFVRFTSGVFPVATWTDRNGDGKCDMVEVFRDGNRIYQLVDADFDGAANVLRVYDNSGELLREERL
ncbi:MAG TPA: hypothetical protein VHG51_01170 [Longimicrobiaceae bacterium]|nr:hypothetical protein [Longimicrobiaceae bacterium]